MCGGTLEQQLLLSPLRGWGGEELFVFGNILAKCRKQESRIKFGGCKRANKIGGLNMDCRSAIVVEEKFLRNRNQLVRHGLAYDWGYWKRALSGRLNVVGR